MILCYVIEFMINGCEWDVYDIFLFWWVKYWKFWWDMVEWLMDMDYSVSILSNNLIGWCVYVVDMC